MGAAMGCSASIPSILHRGEDHAREPVHCEIWIDGILVMPAHAGIHLSFMLRFHPRKTKDQPKRKQARALCTPQSGQPRRKRTLPTSNVPHRQYLCRMPNTPAASSQIARTASRLVSYHGRTTHRTSSCIFPACRPFDLPRNAGTMRPPFVLGARTGYHSAVSKTTRDLATRIQDTT